MSLKTLREKLCIEQADSPTSFPLPIDVQTKINNLIRLIDRHRPLDVAGNHGNLHTATCGCAASTKAHSEGDYWCGETHHRNDFL